MLHRLIRTQEASKSSAAAGLWSRGGIDTAEPSRIKSVRWDRRKRKREEEEEEEEDYDIIALVVRINPQLPYKTPAGQIAGSPRLATAANHPLRYSALC